MTTAAVTKALLSIIDRLIQLVGYRKKRFSSMFHEVIEPTFNDLLLVHGDYIKMFQATYRILKENGPDEPSRVAKAIEYLSQKRIEFEPVRDKLRVFASRLDTSKLEPDVVSFVEAVLRYFPNACIPRVTSASADLLERIGKVQYPSGKVLYPSENYLKSGDEIRGDDDPHASVLAFIPKLIDRHRENWSHVCEAYLPLKLRAAQSST